MAKGESKRDRLAAAFAKQQNNSKEYSVEETPIDDLFAKEENTENAVDIKKEQISDLSEDIKENTRDDETESVSHQEQETETLIVEEENNILVTPEADNDIGTEPKIAYNFQSRAIRQMSGAVQDEIKKEGINLRYSEENEDFLRIQSMKHRMSKTEFVLTLVENVMAELSSEEISEEEFAKHARVGRRYDRTYKNHRYVFPEEITYFLQEESARRGMSVPVFFEMILNQYKKSL